MADQILVRIMTLAAGPDFVHQPGTEVLLPRQQAEAMIGAGHAHRLAAEPAQGGIVQAAAPPAPSDETGPESWTATAAEADDEPEGDEEAAVESSNAGSRPVETATAGPQRSSEAADALAAEAAGREAAKSKQPRSSNPHDRRTTLGRAWDRGWESVG